MWYLLGDSYYHLGANIQMARPLQLAATALRRAAASGPYGNHYKRHVYGTAARIWNTGGLRENQ